MCIIINRISRNIALDGIPHLRTFALLSWEGISPWTIFLDSYDQTSFLHSLKRTSMTAFTHLWTTRYLRIGHPTQHIYIYIYIDIYWAYHTYIYIALLNLFNSIARPLYLFSMLWLDIPHLYLTICVCYQKVNGILRRHCWTYWISHYFYQMLIIQLNP